MKHESPYVCIVLYVMLPHSQIPYRLHHFVYLPAIYECLFPYGLDNKMCYEAFEYLTIHFWGNGPINFIV